MVMEERRRLDSWKEIVAYLKKSEKTCRLWERKFGLPVRRIADSPKARVFAYADEINRWLQEILEQQADVAKNGIPSVLGVGDSDGLGLRCSGYGEHGNTVVAAQGGAETTSLPEALRLPEAKEYDLKTLLKIVRKPRILFPTVAILVVIGCGSYWLLNRSAKIRWAKYRAIPEIEQLVSDKSIAKAFETAQKAKKYIPKDAKLASLLLEVECQISFQTDPPGADVYLKDYLRIDDPWTFLGRTPIQRRPIYRGYFRWKIKKEGYEAAEGTADTSKEFIYNQALANPDEFRISKERFVEVLKETAIDIKRGLDKQGIPPKGMLAIPEGTLIYPTYWYEGPFNRTKFEKFFIDQYEVTNRQYKEFIDRGGYKNPIFWKQKFIKNGRILPWEKGVAEFVDKTGRLGPAGWRAGTYPEGEENLPVRGISWYEAAAYAEFADKSLPSIAHWLYAAGLSFDLWLRTHNFCPQLSNYSGKGPTSVGQFKGLGPFGTYDMAGNVREWCWNETGDRRYILGGSWTEAPKGFGIPESESAFNRSESNGFRCAKYFFPEKVPQQLLGPFNLPSKPDYGNEKPCSDEAFEAIRSLYVYKKTELNPKIESVDKNHRDFALETVSFDAAYGDERVSVRVYLPKNFAPPFQAVLYVGGSPGLFSSPPQGELELWDFIIKSGRAFIWPVLKWTYERGGGEALEPTVSVAEFYITWYKDLARTVDYLETRKDIDAENIAYLGFSAGGHNAPVLTTLEQRIKTVIMVSSGFREAELDPPSGKAANFTPRMNRPLLMINGRYDSVVPVETSQKPLFKLFGAPEEHKKHVILETDHSVHLELDKLMKEILDWLDKYLGPVK